MIRHQQSKFDINIGINIDINDFGSTDGSVIQSSSRQTRSGCSCLNKGSWLPQEFALKVKKVFRSVSLYQVERGGKGNRSMALFLNNGVQGAAHCCLLPPTPSTRRVGFVQGNVLRAHMPPSIITRGFCQPKWLQPGRICSFYDRQQELVLLENYASGSGELLLLTGPADSGKTALLRHFEKRSSALTSFIDLRGGTFTMAVAFAAALKKSWKVSFKVKVITSLALKGIPLTIDMEPELASIEQASGLTELLDSLYSFMFKSKNQNLFQQVLGTPRGTPTLIIDEANELHHWVKDAEPDLRALLNFLVKVTKQDRLANVILASSEDFFHSWLCSNVGSKNRLKTGVVGDFSDADARDFLKQEYEVTVPDHLWSSIYGTIGGRALLLTELGNLFSRNKAVDLQELWVAFYNDFMDSEIHFHKKGLNPHLVTGGKDSWTANQYLGILRIICNSKGGVVHYETLGERFGFEAVDGLIRYKFLHYRPYRAFAWAKDLRWYEGKWPIVMPCSLLSYHAMGFILEEREVKK